MDELVVEGEDETALALAAAVAADATDDYDDRDSVL